jgi:hypothetical protein
MSKLVSLSCYNEFCCYFGREMVVNLEAYELRDLYCFSCGYPVYESDQGDQHSDIRYLDEGVNNEYYDEYFLE